MAKQDQMITCTKKQMKGKKPVSGQDEAVRRIKRHGEVDRWSKAEVKRTKQQNKRSKQANEDSKEVKNWKEPQMVEPREGEWKRRMQQKRES